MKNLIYLIILFVSTGAWARPEYSLQSHINQCTACHLSPTGGGIRNQAGKFFGSHSFSTKSLKDEFFALDLRGQLGHAKRGQQVAKGFMLMNSITSVQLPVRGTEEAPDFTVVASYNFGMMGAGMRETFVMLHKIDEPNSQRLLLGKFAAPFGLQTDEHRTYTKVMVNTTNREFESGAQWSLDPTYRFHFDLAIVNGFQNEGTPLMHKDPWGVIGNVRFMPDTAKLFVGVSHSEHGHSGISTPLRASSFYAGVSTESLFNGSITAETVFAKGWNDSTYNSGSGIAGAGIDYFIPAAETTWRAALKDSESMGFAMNVIWDFSSKLGILYRMEEFIPDVDYRGDFFHRDGVGFRKIISPQSQIIFRVDSGKLNRQGVNVDGLKSTGDNIFVLFHFWI